MQLTRKCCHVRFLTRTSVIIVLGGMGLGMMPQSAASSSAPHRRSPRPSDRATMGGNLHNALSNKTAGGGNNKDLSTGSGTNPDEPIDFNLLSDIPSWLKSLRLHKYTPNFEKDHWEKMIMYTNDDLEGRGVAALGARRKLLKVFENVRNAQGIPVSSSDFTISPATAQLYRDSKSSFYLFACSTRLDLKFLVKTARRNKWILSLESRGYRTSVTF